MHHFKISDQVSDCFISQQTELRTLWFKLLQLSIDEFEMRLAEVDFRKTILA